MNNIAKIIILFVGVNIFTWLLYFIVISNVPADWISKDSLTLPCIVSVFSLIALVVEIISHDENYDV